MEDEIEKRSCWDCDNNTICSHHKAMDGVIDQQFHYVTRISRIEIFKMMAGSCTKYREADDE